MEAEMKEGDNIVTYYLRSDLNDATRKAIDRTPKTITLKADWTEPLLSPYPEAETVRMYGRTDRLVRLSREPFIMLLFRKLMRN